MPALDVRKLENGVRVYCVPRTIGPVSISMAIDRGAEDSPPGKSGTAALTARLLVESTRRRAPLALAQAAETLGSTLSSSAQRDYIAISLETLPRDFDRGVALLAEAIREPAWSTNDFLRVRDQWLDDLQAERQSPSALAAIVAMRATFGTERGSPVNGSIPDVKSLTISDLKAWYNTFVAPANLALIVSGPLEPDATMAAARKALGSWTGAGTNRVPIQYTPVNQDNRVIVVNRPDAVQSAIFVAQPFPSRLEAGHEARLVLNDVLGGLFTSRINMNLREQHAYTYGAHSMVISNRSFGLFAVQTSVRTDVTAPALNELLTEIRNIAGSPARKPVQQAELTRARADLSNRLGAHLEQNRLLAIDAENIFAEGLAPTYLAKAPSIYASLTLTDVAAAAQELKPSALTLVIVGDEKAITNPLRQSGFSAVEPRPEWTD
jgi:zinc protease